MDIELREKIEAALGECMGEYTPQELVAKMGADKDSLRVLADGGVIGLRLDEYNHATPAAVMLDGLTAEEIYRDRERCRQESGYVSYASDCGDTSVWAVLVCDDDQPEGDSPGELAEWYGRNSASEGEREYGYVFVMGRTADLCAAATAALKALAKAEDREDPELR